MSRIRANTITNKAATGAPTFSNGAVVTGVCTATSFVGSGAGLTGVSAGKILQFKYSSTSTEVQSTSTTLIDTGLSLTITPSSASNLIILWGSNHMKSQQDWSHAMTGQYLHRSISGGSSGVIYYPPNSNSSGGNYATELYQSLPTMGETAGSYTTIVIGRVPFNYTDSTHNTTSAITYKIQFKCHTAGSDRNASAISSYNDAIAVLYAMEVAP